MRTSIPRLRILPVLVLPALFFPRAADAQELAEDIADLNLRFQTKHYALAGTITDRRFEEYGRALEAIYTHYAAGFGDLFEKNEREHSGTRSKKRKRRAARNRDPADASPDRTTHEDASGQGEPFGQSFRVIIFARKQEYEKFGKKYFGEFAEHTSGIFSSAAKCLLIQDNANSSETNRILYHEAFHQFIRRYVPAVPVWLNEGLATHYGTARLADYEIVLDRPVRYYHRVVCDAANRKKLIPLDELMTLSHSAFYDQTEIEELDVRYKVLCYAQSYTLIAYMLSIPEGRTLLQKYVKDLAKAKTPQQADQITKKTFTKKINRALLPGWMRLIQGG